MTVRTVIEFADGDVQEFADTDTHRYSLRPDGSFLFLMEETPDSPGGTNFHYWPLHLIKKATKYGQRT